MCDPLQESVLDIEYVFAVEPPKPKQQHPHDDWCAMQVDTNLCQDMLHALKSGLYLKACGNVGSVAWLCEQTLSSPAAMMECCAAGKVSLTPHTSAS